jgi:hypothetical protein
MSLASNFQIAPAQYKTNKFKGMEGDDPVAFLNEQLPATLSAAEAGEECARLVAALKLEIASLDSDLSDRRAELS